MSKFFHHAFTSSGHRCVYCCRDLLADFDSFMLAEEDHLVPESKGGTDSQDNIVIACAVCNRLKHDYTPEIGFDPSKRNEYIVSVRQHIMSKRAKHIETFAGWACAPAAP